MSAIELELHITLMREIARYLALVDLLRREGLEPSWRPEKRSRSCSDADHKRDRPRQAG